MAKMVNQLDIDEMPVMGRPDKPMPSREDIVNALNAGHGGRGAGKDYVTRIAKVYFASSGGTLRKWMEHYDIKRTAKVTFS